MHIHHGLDEFDLKRLRSTNIEWIWVLLLVFMPACAGDVVVSPSPTVEQGTSSPHTTTAVVQPTATHTPQTGKVILVTSPDQPALSASVAETTSALAASSGWLFEERSGLQAADIGEDWRVVIFLGYDPVLSEALQTAHVQFIVYSQQDLGMVENLNVVRVRQEYQAFIAGYISVLITPDWRAGGVFTNDETGSLSAEAYLTGGHYYCGICNSVYSPIVRFPVTARLDAGVDEGVWRPEIDALLTNILYGMYVAPQAGSPEMLTDLTTRGIVLMGGQSPPEELRSRWAATITLDYLSPLEQLWPLVAAGQGDNVMDTPVLIQDINEEFFSPGRQRLVEQTLADLESGWIYPFELP